MKRIEVSYKLNILVMVFSLVMVLGSVLVIIHWKKLSDLLLGLMGFLLFGIVFIYPIYRVLFKKIAIVIDDEGISYDIYPGVVDQYKWNEIKEIRFYQYRIGVVMCIKLYNDPVFRYWAHNMIPQIFVGQSLFELADEIKQMNYFKGDVFGLLGFREYKFAKKTFFIVLLLIGIIFGVAYLYLNK